MFPPSQPPTSNTNPIDLAALSGICGSISIACWVVVFSPQIIENFQRSSAEGLSIVFLLIWLLGDVFNILGAILQGVLPTMTILAVYYTLADIVLICQCFYYRGFTFSDEVPASDGGGGGGGAAVGEDPERRPLLQSSASATASATATASGLERRDHHLVVDPTHLSPAMPLHTPSMLSGSNHPAPENGTTAAAAAAAATPRAQPQNQQPGSRLQTALFNTMAILLVCAAGVFGWWLSEHATSETKKEKKAPNRSAADGSSVLEFDLWGQIFGYLCAVLYLGSRIPQLLLNYRRKSTEGVSLLFFLFACVGNLTYDMSIFAFDPSRFCQGGHSADAQQCGPGEASRIYARYIAVNASWIAGSLGTLFLDMCIFVQFFMYRVEGA